MAHPYANHNQNAVAHKRAKKYLEGGPVEPLKPEGPLEKLAVNTYRRELGRDKGGKFGVNPYIYPRTSGSGKASGGGVKKDTKEPPKPQPPLDSAIEEVKTRFPKTLDYLGKRRGGRT